MDNAQHIRGKVQTSIVQTSDSMWHHADDEEEPVGGNYLR